MRTTNETTRRRFLTTAASAPLLLGATCNSLTAAPKKRPPRVDAHLHCFAGNGDSRFPYHRRAPYRPDDAATPEHLLKCMDNGGVDYAVRLVEGGKV